MQELYQNILNGLKSSHYFYATKYQDTFENYLSNLQPAVEILRTAYRNDKVSIDYSDLDIQAAYLLVYYPCNVEMTLYMLRKLREHLIFPKEVKVCCFGGGPGPEIVALSQFLAERKEQPRKLIANIYDIAAETWSPSRKVTGSYILPKDLRPRIFIRSKVLDFCGQDSFRQVYISGTQLFIFQNCINELNNSSIFQENLTFLLDNMEMGSVLILADLYYKCNKQAIESIKAKLQKRGDYEILIHETYIEIQSLLFIPQIIFANLLTGQANLIRRKFIKFMWLAVRKSQHPDLPLLDDGYIKLEGLVKLDKFDMRDIPF